jgi:hypothetical protein
MTLPKYVHYASQQSLYISEDQDPIPAYYLGYDKMAQKYAPDIAEG